MTVAWQYIDAVNRADIEALMGLFAPSACLNHPAGTFADPHAIRNFYETVVFAGRAVTEIDASFSDGDTEILQIKASSPLGEPGKFVYAADVFTLRDGFIERLDIYYR
ncbi:nuclear transport factor 2 family protein [Mycobacterium sp. pW049]|uniref:nuclear transport factor 2 family protein n=1 Tax=[Mycobacterium] bulgaricum TaxID=3238985 RepID=UPI00351BAF03